MASDRGCRSPSVLALVVTEAGEADRCAVTGDTNSSLNLRCLASTHFLGISQNTERRQCRGLCYSSTHFWYYTNLDVGVCSSFNRCDSSCRDPTNLVALVKAPQF